MRIFDQLRNHENFTMTENVIADYVMNNARDVVAFSLDELADKLFVSKSTVIRFCKKLGFKGHKEFTVELARELDNFLYQDRIINPGSPYNYEDNRSALAQKTYKIMADALEETWQDISQAELMSIARAIYENFTVIYAAGDRYITALELALRLHQLGCQAEVVPPVETTTQRAGRQKEGCALFLTYDGNEPYLIQSARLLKDNHIPIYLISGPDKGTLSRMADEKVHLSYYEPQPKQVSWGSEVSFALVLNIIYAYVFAMDFKKNDEIVRRDNAFSGKLAE